ncbi:MAG: AAA family ATPase [Tyzzerella sp.]|nr:AAA family ATPase [Tyzzerella sp.]
MRLIRCHIENFGKLHDYTIDFEKGANVICEENGWGKSTLAAFIRAMFYGLEGERKRSIEENERKRYTPWQGGVFGGQLTFEVDGKEYTVTRTFNEQDEFELRDAKTNLISDDYSSKLGEELFKVDRESFMRTVFIGQADCETSVTDDINAKIGNLTDNSNDLNSYEAASARLKDLLNSLTPSRKTGSISQRKNEITELDRKVVAQKGIPEALQKLQEKRSEELQVYNQLKVQLQTLQNEQTRLSNLQRILAMKEQWDNLKREVQGVRKVFVDDVPSMELIDEVQKHYSEMEKASERMASYKLTESEKEQLSTLQKTDKQNEKGIPVLQIIGLLFVVIGFIMMAAISVGIGIAAAIVGGILIVVGVVSDNKKKVVRKDAEELRQSMRTSLENKQKKLSESKADYEYHQKEIFAFLAQHGFEPAHNVQLQLLNIRDAVQTYAESLRKLELFEGEMDTSLFATVTEEDKAKNLSELNADIQTVTGEREEIYKHLEAYQADIEQLQAQLEEWEENKLRLEELNDIQAKEQEKYNHILKVQEYLAKAKESITNRYAAPILESFSKYYEMITSASAEEFHIDANTNITETKQGKQRETNTQSSGYRDLIGICLRVALVDAMYKEEAPVLIMDDPFTNLDDEKIQKAKKFLEFVAEKYQVIYFTCSESRR